MHCAACALLVLLSIATALRMMCHSPRIHATNPQEFIQQYLRMRPSEAQARGRSPKGELPDPSVFYQYHDDPYQIMPRVYCLHD